MKKKSIRQMLEMIADNLAPADDAEQRGTEAGTGDGVSAAERLGRAMLDRIGGAGDGVTEDELVDALLEEWDGEAGPEDEGEEDYNEGEPDEYELEEEEEEEDGEPFTVNRRPVPMRAASAASAPVDYAEMSAKQFNDLKKLLKKASADGKRIRL